MVDEGPECQSIPLASMGELVMDIFHHLPPESKADRQRNARRRPPRITARAENHLVNIEWRIARLGAFVASGRVDRSLIVERLGVAIELSRLVDLLADEVSGCGAS
jgi:hypothetical protein